MADLSNFANQFTKGYTWQDIENDPMYAHFKGMVPNQPNINYKNINFRNSPQWMLGDKDPNKMFQNAWAQQGKNLAQPFNFQADPGYQWRLNQGMKGIEKSAAANGALQSGATLKALNNHNQNFASEEYLRAYDRWNQNRDWTNNQLNNRMGTIADMTKGSYDDIKGQKLSNYGNKLQQFQLLHDLGNEGYGKQQDFLQNLYNRVSNLSGLGQTALSQSGQMNLGANGSLADLYSQIGNSLSAGKIGQANARTNAQNASTNSLLSLLSGAAGLYKGGK